MTLDVASREDLRASSVSQIRLPGRICAARHLDGLAVRPGTARWLTGFGDHRLLARRHRRSVRHAGEGCARPEVIAWDDEQDWSLERSASVW